jgi:hypothetical protein
MSNDRTDIVTVVIEPLAERLEAASKATYPAGEVSFATLDIALRRSHFETGRRLLEFSVSSAYACVFMRTIEAGILPWPEDTAGATAAELFRQWLASRGTVGAMDMESAIQQISKMWDEVEHSGGAIAWDWILRRSYHGAKLRRAEERVDTIGSKGQPAALASVDC